jgi:lipopolysaccharide/colanic/teichoic acid biosynthesis glycosyltransferase
MNQMSLGETEFEAEASLDELPQVFNVLKDELSLVDPARVGCSTMRSIHSASSPILSTSTTRRSGLT